MKKPFRCRWGFHNWQLFEMSPEFKQAFPELGHKGRSCSRCGELQYLNDDGAGWGIGLRGSLGKLISMGTYE